jgi:hypothetical protein
MTAKPLSQLLTHLGVEQSHSRPHTSNDNPFSEAHFKTMKYRPDYPDPFPTLQDARTWAEQFFTWYNEFRLEPLYSQQCPLWRSSCATSTPTGCFGSGFCTASATLPSR